MTDPHKYIIRKIEEADPGRVGQKAWNLFLLNDKFLIPEFVVVSSDAFEYYHLNKTTNPEIDKQLRNALESLLEIGIVAIRSSGTAEDLTGASFAGMYKTFLGIKDIESGIDAIHNVWESADSERVKSYSKEMNIKVGSMAVIIQHQLNPERSGVLITQSPYSIDEVLIECCSGLGEKLVSGLITPTRYRIKTDQVIEHTGEALLNIEQIKHLAQSGKKIEDFFKSPQEIEWAIEDSNLYILQSRPISVKWAKPRRKGRVWCNVNVRETIPEPISQLMWSFFDEFLFPMIILDIFGFPISREKFRKHPPVENLSGRLYWNINNTIAYGKVIAPFLDLLESNKNLDPQMALAFKSVNRKDIPALLQPIQAFGFGIISLFRLTNFIIKSYFFHRNFAKKIHNTNIEFEKNIDKMVISTDFEQGLRNIEEWIALKNFAKKYFGGLFLSLFYLIILERILGWRLGKKGKAIARRCASGIVDNTVLIVNALNRLSKIVYKKIKNPTIESIKQLFQTGQEFKNQFDQFVKEYGHRGPGEFDIANKTYAEDPEIVMHLLVAPRYASDLVNRKDVIKEILHSLNPFERFVVKSFLPRLETFIPLRENGKHYYFKQMAKIKKQLFTIAEFLKDRSLIKDKRDIFFLSFSELKNVCAMKFENTEVIALIEKRKQKWQLYRDASVPDIIFESGERISTALPTGNIISGKPLSFGKARARACIVKELKDADKLKNGEILVTHHTDPAWTPLFSIASGVIIEVGGFVCHAATVAREMGIPAVVIKGASSIIKDGQEIELDADSGSVEIIS